MGKPSFSEGGFFAISAHMPFLEGLAAGVLARTDPDDPAALSRTTIFLPTQRAARGLGKAFLARAGGRGMLLPRFSALAGLSVEDADELALPGLLDLPPAVSPARRQAALTAMVMRLPRRHGGPGTPEQAWRLASELAKLMDEMALEGADPVHLPDLVPERLAIHWQITLTFLEGVISAWNTWLDEAGLMDIGPRRVAALKARAEAWERDPPQDPVIAAGIGAGGTIPGAVTLMGVIAQMPKGAVVFQGMPDTEDPALWQAILESPTHPLAGQARILRSLGVKPRDLRDFLPADLAAELPSMGEDRAGLIARALRPAEGIAAWRVRERHRWERALGGLSRLTAPDAQAEASAIALTLREAIETPGTSAALVTPDRDLARRVSAELSRHGVTADDSAGEPLSQTPAGAFLRLLCRAVADDLAPVPLLALLKHPMASGGLERADWLTGVRALELRALRGPRPAPGIEGLRAAMGERPAPALIALVEALARALDGFASLPNAPNRTPAQLMEAHLTAAEALAATPGEPGGLRLYANDEGETLATHIASLTAALDGLPPISPAAWPALFEAMMEGPLAPSVRAVRNKEAAPHPRIAVLGLLEARLQCFDRVILGALEETIWPQATDPGPWMSRPMRADFGLPEPETRIGRVAADFFYLAAGCGEVVLSTAARRGGAPSVQARWLTRLDTFLEGQGIGGLPASPAAGWAAALDQPERVTPTSRPSPRPPLKSRPARLTVSDTATLIADPYAFYARRILRLRPIDPLDADVGAADYGELVHDAIAAFLKAIGLGWPGEEAARAHWAAASEAALAKSAPRPGIAAFWAPRLENIGAFVIEQEALLRQNGGLLALHAEITGKLTMRREGGDVELEARADRLDQIATGAWRVIDYKTGTTPSQREMLDGTAPQLPMEGAMLQLGGFPGIPGGSVVTKLSYWSLSGGEEAGKIAMVDAVTKDGVDLLDLAREKVGELADTYLLGMAAFPARPHPARAPRGIDFDHLSRLAEWTTEPEEGA
ncbi:double-strand break repair protein AddB [Acetobacteraceae bacterium H6797]|nr:double-strand break repair protein AddB [Acetobacteraceae bacterium H6797]